eukprot:10512745-Alexandrium_andersonii.AAC.1
MVQASPGVSPRLREAAWNAMTAHGAPRTAIAVHRPCRNAGDASIVTRMWDWSGSCCSLRNLSWSRDSA